MGLEEDHIPCSLVSPTQIFVEFVNVALPSIRASRGPFRKDRDGSVRLSLSKIPATLFGSTKDLIRSVYIYVARHTLSSSEVM